MLPKDSWYVAARDHEIKQKPLGRTICGEPVVLSRNPDRGVVALEGITPPFWVANLKLNAPWHRWQICNLTLPVNMIIDVGVALTGTGAPERDRAGGVLACRLKLGRATAQGSA